MNKMLWMAAFLLLTTYGYAQTENEEVQGASQHGATISEIAKSATVTGQEKGRLISSAARAKALIYANANARFIRGDMKPAHASEQPGELPTLNGKPATLPPVTAPTTGKPAATPVGNPVGVPVGAKPAIPGGR
jgi:hypothetical protein